MRNDKVTVVCYGTSREWKRKEAIAFYEEGVRCCEGSEKDRYVTILLQLYGGGKVCRDRG